jgi:uncharacterized protein
MVSPYQKPSLKSKICQYVGLTPFLKLSTPNAAGMAALYGSVSSVTFLAALNFTARVGNPAEPFLPVLVSIMEWGILTALFWARLAMRREAAGA